MRNFAFLILTLFGLSEALFSTYICGTLLLDSGKPAVGYTFVFGGSMLFSDENGIFSFQANKVSPTSPLYFVITNKINFDSVLGGSTSLKTSLSNLLGTLSNSDYRVLKISVADDYEKLFISFASLNELTGVFLDRVLFLFINPNYLALDPGTSSCKCFSKDCLTLPNIKIKSFNDVEKAKNKSMRNYDVVRNRLPSKTVINSSGALMKNLDYARNKGRSQTLRKVGDSHQSVLLTKGF